MEMVDHAPTTPEPRGELHGSAPLTVRDLGRRWATAIGSASVAAASRAELERVLTGLADRLRDALLTEPFDPHAGELVGSALVTADLLSSESLQRSIALLGADLPAALGRRLDGPLPGRLFALLGAVAAGYSDALRDRTLDQQEVSRTAAINTLRRAERAVRASEAKFRAVFTSSAVGIAITGLDGRVLDFNDAMQNMLGYPPEVLRRSTVRELIHPDDRAALALSTSELTAGVREHFRAEKRMIRADGDTVSTLLAVSLVRDATGNPAYYVTMVENLNELRLLQDQLVRQSLHDALTGLPNRSQFVGWLESAVGAKGPDRLALCQFDLDGFRVINEGFGHDVGNRVLLTVANHLRAVFGEVGQVARTGGDEFAVLIREPADVRGVLALVEQAGALFAEPIYVDGHGIAVTASVGVVEHRARGVDAADLLRAADLTVSWAKADGKAQWALYDQARDERGRERLTLAASIPGGLESGEFQMDYAPVLGLVGGRVVAVEARLRWDHPSAGLVGLDDLADLLDVTGHLMTLVRWGYQDSARQAGRWLREHGDVPPLVVPLFPRHARDQELIGHVQEVLRASGLPADRLRLRLHHEALRALDEDSADNLAVLLELGVGLVLDGVGPEGISHAVLRRLPRVEVRLAPAAVRELATDPAVATMVTALVARGVAEGFTVTADLVETPDEVARLASLGVSAGLGPALCPLLPAAEVEPRLFPTW